MEKRKEKADQNAVAELTREWLYKENKWLWEENQKLKEKLDNRDLLLEWKRKEVQTLFKVNEELTAKNKKLKEDVDFYYKSAKQFREQVEKWEKDFVEWRIVEKD